MPATQTNRLQFILNSASRAVTKTINFHFIIYSYTSVSPLVQDKRIRQGSLSHINISKLVKLLTSTLFFHSPFVLLVPLLLLP